MEQTQENEKKIEGSPSVCTAGLPPIEPAGETTPHVGAAGLEAVAPAPFYKKHLTLIVSIVVALAIVLGAGYFAYVSYYAKGGTVAVVNGKHIYQEELAESISLIEQSASAQGANLTDESVRSEIRTQALEVLVNNALLITAARSAGISATDADIQAKYDELVTELGSQEELTKKMAEIGLTEKKLRINIEERILADGYIETHTDLKNLSVTDEEVAELMKTIPEGEQKPSTDEIKQWILSQKQQQVVTDLIAKLRAEGKVNILLK